MPLISQVSRNIFARGISASLYPILRQRRRPKTFLLRDRWRIGTRTWVLCRSSLIPSNSKAKVPFSLVQPSSSLTLRLYAKRSTHPDILVGTHEMRIPLASQSGSFYRECLLFNRLNISRADIRCVLENGVGNTARSTQPATLYIEVNITSPTLYSSPASIPKGDGGSPAEEAPIPGHTQPPSPEHPLPLRLALDQADQAMKQIDKSNTWQGAVGKIKWVMDTLSPIAEVRVIPF